ncbi:MAG: ABC transporter permease, partial [Chloroflexi bacterium]|nr:ABC transporter permease [Chloroflexota bacterium]
MKELGQVLILNRKALLAVEKNAPGLWQLAGRRFLRHRAGVISTMVLLAIVAIVTLGPLFFVPRDAAFRPDPLVINQPPGVEHWFGTDQVGRDIFARIVYGGQISLAIGLLAMVVSIMVGVLLGSVSGYFGGLVDGAIMRFTDAMLSIPGIFLIIALTVFLGATLPTIILSIGFLNWMIIARVMRALFLSLKEQDFVMAARCLGVKNVRIMWGHILPNAIAPVVVTATLTVGEAILTETAISYLGLGIQPPTPSWG